MRVKVHISMLLLLVMSVVYADRCYGQSTTHYIDSTIDIQLHFRLNRSVIDNGYLNNAGSLLVLDELLKDSSTISSIDSMVIHAACSPEGVQEHNNLLARRRAEAIKKYIAWKYPQTKETQIQTYANGEDWSGLRKLVERDGNVPHQERILEIIDQEINVGTKKWRLQQVANGKSWQYIDKHLFKYLRSGTTHITIYCKSKIQQPESTEKKEEVDARETAAEKPEEVIAQEIPAPLPEGKAVIAIKTNLAAYALVVANIGVEASLGEHFSIDLPVYYSPYTVSDSYKFRILATQPELRYWPKEVMNGSFWGAHLMGGWYNIAYNHEVRYQDRDGETPFYGGGFSYGYSLPLKKQWALEFTAGLGYLYFDYDKYYNTKNGALYDSKKKHYWGPTKIGINLIYKFNH